MTDVELPKGVKMEVEAIDDRLHELEEEKNRLLRRRSTLISMVAEEKGPDHPDEALP